MVIPFLTLSVFSMASSCDFSLLMAEVASISETLILNCFCPLKPLVICFKPVEKLLFVPAISRLSLIRRCLELVALFSEATILSSCDLIKAPLSPLILPPPSTPKSRPISCPLTAIFSPSFTKKAWPKPCLKIFYSLV